MIRLSVGNHLWRWKEVYPKFAARLDARLERDCQQSFLVFDVSTWGEANAILYATVPCDIPPPHGE